MTRRINALLSSPAEEDMTESHCGIPEKKKAEIHQHNSRPPPKPNPKGTDTATPNLPHKANALSLPNRLRSKLKEIVETRCNKQLIGEYSLNLKNIKAFIPDPQQPPENKHGKSNCLTLYHTHNQRSTADQTLVKQHD